MGKTFPTEDGRTMDRLEYRAAISAALNHELGGSHRAIKTIMKWAGVSERTAKNCLLGTLGPAGLHLIELLRHSEDVLSAVFILSGHAELRINSNLHETRTRLMQALSDVDDILGIEKLNQSLDE